MDNFYASIGSTWNIGNYYDTGSIKEKCPSLDEYDGYSEERSSYDYCYDDDYSSSYDKF